MGSPVQLAQNQLQSNLNQLAVWFRGRGAGIRELGGVRRPAFRHRHARSFSTGTGPCDAGQFLLHAVRQPDSLVQDDQREDRESLRDLLGRVDI